MTIRQINCQRIFFILYKIVDSYFHFWKQIESMKRYIDITLILNILIRQLEGRIPRGNGNDMDINLIYSKDDPKQTEARDFVYQFVEERGILAHIVETVEPVKSPTFIINGLQFRDMRTHPRSADPAMYPSIPDIAQLIEHHIWCV